MDYKSLLQESVQTVKKSVTYNLQPLTGTFEFNIAFNSAWHTYGYFHPYFRAKSFHSFR